MTTPTYPATELLEIDRAEALSRAEDAKLQLVPEFIAYGKHRHCLALVGTPHDLLKFTLTVAPYLDDRFETMMPDGELSFHLAWLHVLVSSSPVGGRGDEVLYYWPQVRTVRDLNRN